MLDSIYQDIKITLKSHFYIENLRILPYMYICDGLVGYFITFPNFVNHWTCGLSILKHNFISLLDATSYDKLYELLNSGQFSRLVSLLIWVHNVVEKV